MLSFRHLIHTENILPDGLRDVNAEKMFFPPVYTTFLAWKNIFPPDPRRIWSGNRFFFYFRDVNDRKNYFFAKTAG
ncbi:MAG: hypothetical protein P1P88_12350 [Bacteroidales bacterium]|nr:hypothetical protein [Bacteroidales bacterium]